MITILPGDCRTTLQALEPCSVQCCVTSPPYWGLRDYAVTGQLGMETTIDAFVTNLVEVFREVHRVLRDDGTLWLNLGDSYAGSGGAGEWSKRKAGKQEYAGPRGNNVNRLVRSKRMDRGSGRWGGGNLPPTNGLKPKDLCGIPWRVAFALQADGWWLRQDIIWHKPNPMPESVRDRCTKAHEYMFLLSKSARYYYDQGTVKEKSTGQNGAAAGFARDTKEQLIPGQTTKSHRLDQEPTVDNGTRNRRSVWTIPTQPHPEAHFATFPEKLVEPCILAGSRPGDIILDPFAGSGTTGKVALTHNRHFIGCELNPDYIKLIHRRLERVQPNLPLS